MEKNINSDCGFPEFGYHLASSQYVDHGWIVVKNRRYLKICDPKTFYRALGYKDELREVGELPDEFIWRRYTSDQSKFSKLCLQVQIGCSSY